jgi:hypothetical protein
MTEQRSQTRAGAILGDEDAFELLPWYVTGKTTPEETAAIERKLEQSPRLQQELALVRREHAAERQAAEAMGEPSAAVFEKIMSQLDGARQLPPIAGAERAEGGVAGFLGKLLGFMPVPALRLALVAACLAVVVEGAALLQLGSGGATYETASAPDTTAGGPQLIVQFQPNAGIAAIGEAISGVGASIVRGPMPDGAYILALPEGADADAAAAKLRGLTELVSGVEHGA